MAPQGQKCTYPSRGTITFSWDAPTVKTGPTTYVILVSKSKHTSDLSQGQDFIANFTVPGKFFCLRNYFMCKIKSYFCVYSCSQVFMCIVSQAFMFIVCCIKQLKKVYGRKNIVE